MQADPFSILGVGEDADAGEIAAAYRRLAMRWHPDRNPGDPRAAVRFRRARRAYEILRDPRARGFFESARRARADSVFCRHARPPRARALVGDLRRRRWSVGVGGDSQRARFVGISRSRSRSPAACRRRRKPVCKRAFLRFVAVCRLLFFSLAAAGFCCACWTPIWPCADKRNGVGRWPDNERRAVNRIRRARPRVRGARRARFAGGVYDRRISGAATTPETRSKRSPPARTSSKSARRFRIRPRTERRSNAHRSARSPTA